MPEATKSPAEKLAELEYELKMFEDFLKSPIWALLKSQWQPLVDSAVGLALSGTVEDRGFAAGKANGLRNFLQYPEKHAKKLSVSIKQLRGPKIQ
jgi:hypothetical protein